MVIAIPFAVTLAVAVQPEPSLAGPPAGLQWAELPSLIATDYPQAALDAELSGSATVRCNVTDEGVPVLCQAVSEEPVGYGFGAAAVAVVQRGRIDPATIAGNEPFFTVNIPFLLEPMPAEPFASGEQVGSATVQCRLGPTMLAERCRVMSETPAGAGFGEAAVRIVEGQAIAAQAYDGRQVASTFTVRVPFFGPAD